jgi:Lsr2
MQRVEVQLEDDLTGGPADETVEFGIDGRTYAVDLNARHAAEFRRQLSRFVEHARPARARTRGTIRTAASRQRSREIRAWAEQHGLAVAEYGRLPSNIVHQYEAALSGNQPAPRRARRNPGRGQGSSKRRPR